MRTILCVILLLLLAPGPSLAGGPRMLVSIAPTAWFVRQVAGDLGEVQVMLPPGASPHTYEPKPSQMVAVGQAQLYLAIGVEFEQAWLGKFQALNPELVVVHLDEGITKLPMAEHDHHDGADSHGDGPTEALEAGHGTSGAAPAGEPGEANGGLSRHGNSQGEPHEEHHGLDPHGSGHDGHGGLDPHVWLSPELAAVIVGNAQRALSLADPEHAAQYEANARRTLAGITALRAELAPLFKDLPSRRFLVFHPSWGYFAQEFGLEQMPIEVQGREPSPRELHDLVREAAEHGVRAVFVQPQMSQRTAQVVADELKGRLVLADPLAADWDVNLRRVAHELAAAMNKER